MRTVKANSLQTVWGCHAAASFILVAELGIAQRQFFLEGLKCPNLVKDSNDDFTESKASTRTGPAD